MKVFLDTNIFLEYLQRRRQYQAVSQLLSAVEDKRMEDSYQYQCALQNKCDALVTINLKDYRLADTSAQIPRKESPRIAMYPFRARSEKGSNLRGRAGGMGAERRRMERLDENEADLLQ